MIATALVLGALSASAAANPETTGVRIAAAEPGAKYGVSLAIRAGADITFGDVRIEVLK